MIDVRLLSDVRQSNIKPSLETNFGLLFYRCLQNCLPPFPRYCPFDVKIMTHGEMF